MPCDCFGCREKKGKIRENLEGRTNSHIPIFHFPRRFTGTKHMRKKDRDESPGSFREDWDDAVLLQHSCSLTDLIIFSAFPPRKFCGTLECNFSKSWFENGSKNQTEVFLTCLERNFPKVPTTEQGKQWMLIIAPTNTYTTT